MYAWSKKEATLYNGIILGGFGILAVIVVLFSKPLAKKFSEKLLMLVGYVILLISSIAYLYFILIYKEKYIFIIKKTIQQLAYCLGVTSILQFKYQVIKL